MASVNQDRSESRSSKDSVASEQRPDPDGPVIRIGLMSGVTSVSLTSDSGLILKRLQGTSEKSDKVSSNKVTVEVRQPESSVVARKPEDTTTTLCFIEVATLADPAGVRRVVDDVKKFKEPLSTPFDKETDRYIVTMGPFTEKKKARELVKKLHDDGYIAASMIETRQPAKPNPSYSTREVRREAARADVARLNSKQNPMLSRTRLVAHEGGEEIALSDSSLLVSSKSQTGKSGTGIRVNGKEYRGEIRLFLNQQKRINVINELPLEVYLRGVVPMELPPRTYPEIEALKAQAVAARTYALAHLKQFNSEGFDIRDDARSQVYGGVQSEHPLSNRAVEETRGIVVTHRDANGRSVPIDAVYTASCGGGTESNEAMFLSAPAAYLRSVVCLPDQPPAADAFEIETKRFPEPVTGWEDHPGVREMSLLQLLRFDLPARVTGRYLSSTPSTDEMRIWIEWLRDLSKNGQTVRQTPASDTRPGNVSRNSTDGEPRSREILGFAKSLSNLVYGERRRVMPSTEISYWLAGLIDEDLSADLLSPLAALVKDGLLRLPLGTRIRQRTEATRALVVDSLARVVISKPEWSGLRFITVSTDSAASKPGQPEKNNKGRLRGLPQISDQAVLFKRLGGTSYPVTRLLIAGGERLRYHLDSAGRVDFLEAEYSSSSGSARPAAEQWRIRLTAEQVAQRLASAKIDVGEVRDLKPVSVGASNRVLELAIIGSKRESRLRGWSISSVLGLKENTFVIEREEKGSKTEAFIFSGRGWGHGVGMCQTGAYGLAKKGLGFTDILETYYTGSTTKRFY